MKHVHAFDRYNARLDVRVCRCGMSLDPFGGLWNADGSRNQIAVTAYGEGTKPYDRVKSGRELLSC